MEPIYPEERKIKEMCKRWLEGFNCAGAEIKVLELMEQSEVDRLLGLVGVRFSFRINDKVGDGVAFFKVEDVFGRVPSREAEEELELLA